MAAFSSTFQHEGIKGFFKGLVAPVIGTTPYNTMIFTTTEMFKRMIESNADMLSSYTPSIDYRNEEVKNFIGGCASGAVCIIIYNPIEMMKIRAQCNR